MILGTQLAASGPVLAQEASPLPAVRIAYEALPECATAEAFAAEVKSRAPELREATEGEPARQFSAQIVPLEDGTLRGSLRIVEPWGLSATRELRGASCAEVTEALAFIVAELARTVNIEQDAPAAPATAPAPGAARARPSPPRRRRASPRKREAVPATPAPQRARAKVFFEAGTAIEALQAPAPSLVLAPGAYLEVGHGSVRPLLSLRFSARFARSRSLEASIGAAEFRWAAARAEFCGPRWRGATLDFGVCAGADLGELQGSGSGSDEAQRRTALWFAPGAALRGRATLARALLVLGFEAGLFAPLVRPRFYFAGIDGEQPRETVHDVPSVGSRFAISVGVLFP